jgi:AcrR family transcriptional regulator
VGRIADVGTDPARREAVTLGLVDALLDGDGGTLTAALDALRDARARAGDDRELTGWLDAAIAFAHWGLERVPSPAVMAQGTQAHDFLRAVAGGARVASADLRLLLEVDETQVSRTGRRLLESGLVTRGKVGRQVFWQLTPRGAQVLDDAPVAARSPNSAFWQEALRRGFDREPGDDDPVRARIIESALALHGSRGIEATTWPEIAEKAGVPLETVEAMFPTLDDLARSCGEHFMETLRFPPDDRAPEIFVRDSSEHDRVHRLVETVFGAYERGAEGMAAARRERSTVAAVDESVVELDAAFDALVTEALRPTRPGGAEVTSLRALTDLEVWRALRDQGATPEGAVDQASAAVERWLGGRPT